MTGAELFGLLAILDGSVSQSEREKNKKLQNIMKQMKQKAEQLLGTGKKTNDSKRVVSLEQNESD